MFFVSQTIVDTTDHCFEKIDIALDEISGYDRTGGLGRQESRPSVQYNIFCTIRESYAILRYCLS